MIKFINLISFLVFVGTSFSQVAYDSLLYYHVEFKSTELRDVWNEIQPDLKIDSNWQDQPYETYWEKIYFDNQIFYLPNDIEVKINSLSDTSYLYRQYQHGNENYFGVISLDRSNYFSHKVILTAADGDDSLVDHQFFRFKRVGKWNYVPLNGVSINGNYASGKKHGLWLTTEYRQISRTQRFDHGNLVYDSVLNRLQDLSSPQQLIGTWYYSDNPDSRIFTDSSVIVILSNEKPNMHYGYLDFKLNNRMEEKIIIHCGTGNTNPYFDHDWEFYPDTKTIKFGDLINEILFYSEDVLVLKFER